MKDNQILDEDNFKIFIKSILNNIDNNFSKLDKDILNKTPGRVFKAWEEMLSGYKIDDSSLYKLFKSDNKNLIIIKNIEFSSICEHHLLPFTGIMHIGYIPNGKVLGLSKFSRIVDCFSRRLQIQENLVTDIRNSIIKNLQVKDMFVVAEAKHCCICCRGVNQKNSSALNFFMEGKFKKYSEVDVLKLIK